MGLRDERQEEFAEKFFSVKRTIEGFNTDCRGILDLCPRFGKCRVAIKIFRKLGKNPKVLIAYPNVAIKESWIEEFEKTGYDPSNITYTTHLSLEKHVGKKYDIVVLDEIHLLSDRQMDTLHDVVDLDNDKVLGLTGTLSSWTERTLGKRIGMNVIARYSMAEAIEEGVITDYKITIKQVPLDNKTKIQYKTAIRTEKEQFAAYSSVITKMESQNRDTFYLKLARMRIIQNSLSKLRATKDLLKKFSKERVLVFCGLIKISEKLGCPVFHSKSTDQNVFDNFSRGIGNHLAVIKIGNTGVTYRPLNKIIINYFDSNSENLAQKILRCMAMEYDTPDKKADIWIVCSDEAVEQKWLKKALEFFDPKKITYE